MDEFAWPDETPCSGCGWPRYCCLCPADDQCVICGDIFELEELNGSKLCPDCAKAEIETDLYHSFDILGFG